jgi:hypothetical protein
MKSVISASRRTDVPAFYMDWFIAAIRAGKITVQNPVYKRHLFDVDLRPEKVEWIVFWSRNYHRFLKNHHVFCDYNLFFHFTLLTHHPALEKSHLAQADAIRQAEKIAGLYGPRRIIWRYDPIVIWQKSSAIQTNFSPADFRDLCREFSRMGIRSCYFSFAARYKKFMVRFKQRFPEWIVQDAGSLPAQRILHGMKETAAKYRIELFSCCQDILLDADIKKGRCISGDVLNDLSGRNSVSRAKAPTRKECGCTRSIDIGNYMQQPCFTGCVYCYAHTSKYPTRSSRLPR